MARTTAEIQMFAAIRFWEFALQRAVFISMFRVNSGSAMAMNLRHWAVFTKSVPKRPAKSSASIARMAATGSAAIRLNFIDFPYANLRSWGEWP